MPENTIPKKIIQRFFIVFTIFIFILLSLLAIFDHIIGYGLTLPVVLLLGALGSFVSLQRKFRNFNAQELPLQDSWSDIFLAPFVGAVLAGILYLLFLSGLLAGELFPKFSFNPDSKDGAFGGLFSKASENAKDYAKDGAFGGLFSKASENAKDYAKLFFWSFVAGYSEQFVTNIIGRFERKTDSE